MLLRGFNALLLALLAALSSLLCLYWNSSMSENKQESLASPEEVISSALESDVVEAFSALESVYRESETPWSIHLYQRVASTMDTAATLFESRRSAETRHIAVVSLAQSRGRGQRGSSWYSGDSETGMPTAGLYATFACPMPLPLRELSGVSLAVGTALRAAISELGVSASLKWPNDIVVLPNQAVLGQDSLGAKKLAGILIESSALQNPRGASSGRLGEVSLLSVGIGLNINLDKFPKNVAGTSLFLQCDKTFSLFTVFEQVLAKLSHLLIEYSQGGLGAKALSGEGSLIDEYRKYSLDVGRLLRFSLKGVEVVGTVRQVNDDGSLQVELKDGRSISKVYSGVLEGVYPS